MYNDGSSNSAVDTSGVDFSPIGIILAFSLAVVIVVVSIVLGLGDGFLAEKT